jgi:monoamine oxidase
MARLRCCPMRASSLLLYVLLALVGAPRTLAARRLAQALPDETLDVCVVGAGPAGIGAALALTDKGKTVALLEREAVAGGQTAPEYRDPASGFRVHMGAVVITPPDCAFQAIALLHQRSLSRGAGMRDAHTDPTVLKYARRTGLGLQARCSVNRLRTCNAIARTDQRRKSFVLH